jgi:hypothetical protein
MSHTTSTGPVEIRFTTGAIRSSDQDKLDFEGFISPLVWLRFAQYMHKHRRLSDGSFRGSDNWQKGIPQESYVKSLLRHVMDVWLIHRGFEQKAREPIEEALCAILFNAQGLLFEILRAKESSER